ncbi:MAG: hypothetical protein E6J34_12015 [Chloroflexi bacterium]|nr:MAG: hypothetical protein E6J34_12015 [Chloroflexota bacterium]
MRTKLVIRWRPLALLILGIVGLVLRLYGLSWDQGNSFHPDERQIMFHVTVLSWPTSWPQFLDAQNSPLNPHFFAYGSFPLYLLATLGNLLIHFSPSLGSFENMTLLGRVVSAVFDSGTIVLTGWMGLLLTPDEQPGRPMAWNVALLAAALTAFVPLQLQLAHFYAVDSMLLFFVVLTLVSCLVLISTRKVWLWSCIVGVSYGLAMATKFSAAPLAVPICVALLLRWYRDRKGFVALETLLLAAIVTVVSFVVAEPYALLDRQNFITQVADQGSLARGSLDLPYVRQFAGTIPYVYEAQNLFLWGLGAMLGLAALLGCLWICWRIWRREAALWLVPLSWIVVYGGIAGSFYVKFMRYMLPLYPLFTLMAALFIVSMVSREWRIDHSPITLLRRSATLLRYALVTLVLGGTIFQGLALLNIYSQPNTRVEASRWIYSHIKPGSILTYEQWDDALPVAVANHSQTDYRQFSFASAKGTAVMGLDLYGDDTPDKAQMLANALPQIDAITMPTDRLDKSIPRLPSRYPLTIHYYQLLFSGQLGFHLAAQFENHPHLLGITLDDSNADESYSVFDHPTARIFVRDNPYPYTATQLYQKLMQGVQLPPSGTALAGTQRSLLLSPQQIDENQQAPPFASQFPTDSLANTAPVLCWWLVLTLLGVLTYPLLFTPFRPLADRGYIFSKLFGLLFLAYFAWLLAATHVLALSQFSIEVVLACLAIAGATAFFFQRIALMDFLRQHWRRLLCYEGIFTLAFFLFVAIRSFNPDLWQIYRGGEKPMELAIFNAVLRSPYMPPLDPWFAGGYINYYYYGYVIIGVLTKLTGIIPTVAFNLAIPTLFALTLTGAMVIVYSFTSNMLVAFLARYFTALISNFHVLIQLRGQLLASLAHKAVSPFDFWQSSRIIPFTINEFPFWSFLFADVHPHVIDMPIGVCMLGLLAACLLSHQQPDSASAAKRLRREQVWRYGLVAFVFGTIACVNPWDMPVYLILLALVLLLQIIQEQRQAPRVELLLSMGLRLATVFLIYTIGYSCYLPFYLAYQQLYVNGLGVVTAGMTTGAGTFFTIFGFWIYIALSFFLVLLYDHWIKPWFGGKAPLAFPGHPQGMPLQWNEHAWEADSSIVGASLVGALGRRLTILHWRNSRYLLICLLLLCAFVFGNLRGFLAASLLLGTYLFVAYVWTLLLKPDSAHEHGASEEIRTATPSQSALHHAAFLYSCVLLLMGLCICLGLELVYIRDFLDGGDYARMNTVFKFSIQAWLCFAIGSALAVYYLWQRLQGMVRHVWMTVFAALMVACSIFLVAGTPARIADHQLQATILKPALSSDYTPTLDGFAMVKAWFPSDAKAITWLNAYVPGSPVLLEASVPGTSYQWFNRVSVYTGLPDVLGWSDHVGEQRYDVQLANRQADIAFIYTTPDLEPALQLLRYYHVRYIYVGQLERDAYAAHSSAGLDKFDHMAGVRVVYRADGVTIYEVA